MSQRSQKKMLLAASASLALASAVQAMPTIDGTLDADYGAPLALQKAQTTWGDSNLGQQDWANGSELDSAYGKIEGGNLYLFFGGNLESNWNHLDIFLDTGAGGQHTIANNNVDVDYNALNNMAGLTFDTGFAATHYIGMAGGDTSGAGTYGLYVNYATMPAAGAGIGTYSGPSPTNGRMVVFSGTGTPADGITAVIDNSNTVGVQSGNMAITLPAEDPSAVKTGMELQIPMAALGSPSGDVKVTAFINGGGHTYLSNQMLPAIDPGTGTATDLGSPTTLSFDSIPGAPHYFTVTNPPAFIKGDMNGDGSFNNFDITPFVLALTDVNTYNTQYPAMASIYTQVGDMNSDGSFNNFDITPFVTALTSPHAAEQMAAALASVPEPASLGLLAVGGVAMARRRKTR